MQKQKNTFWGRKLFCEIAFSENKYFPCLGINNEKEIIVFQLQILIVFDL